MEIRRDLYLDKLIANMWDGQVKVITGIRRCGKSYLLHNIFYNYLLSQNIKKNNILIYELDLAKDIKYRNPLTLASTVRNIVENKKEQYYLFIDEIQMSSVVNNPYDPTFDKINFYDALNDLNSLSNLDIYVTGSNSKLLANDILTQFRGRSDEIKMYPLSFKEYYDTVSGDVSLCYDDYSFYGGLPLILSKKNETLKINYLKSLFNEVYLKDIIERKKVQRVDILSMIIDLLSSSIGSLTNPNNIAKAINSKCELSKKDAVSVNTVKTYLDYLIDAYLFEECKRYDVKGKNYFDYPNKYYCVDLGLRNARTGFRQVEPPHIMENIIYNDLKIKGYEVDVGVVYSNQKDNKGKSIKTAREIDFIAYSGNKKFYIQSAYSLDNDQKINIENKPFSLTNDYFPKIIVRRDISKRFYNEQGVLNIGITDFLLDDNLL